MWPISVVVGHEGAQHRQQVVLVKDDQVVETLVPEGPDDAFDDRVRPRRPHGCGDGIDADALGSSSEVPP
jgi:hypothetical protein